METIELVTWYYSLPKFVDVLLGNLMQNQAKQPIEQKPFKAPNEKSVDLCGS